jgi:hypothetical protein
MCTIMPAPILGHTWTIQAGTRETTKIVNGNEDVQTGRKSNERVHSYLDRHLNQESSHKQERISSITRLHSRWNSGSRDMVDKPPSQPRSRRRMSGGRPSSATLVKESHQEDPRTSEVRRLQQSDSMWTSGGARTTNIRPPLRRGKAFRRFHHGACRWTSSSRSALDRVPTPAPAPHRMIVGLSSVSALKPYYIGKDQLNLRQLELALSLCDI